MNKGMKKTIIALIMIAVALTGCGGKKKAEFGYDNGSVLLIPGERFVPDAKGIGETVGYMEAASCYFNGLDKVFSYDGYDVKTYPSSDGDYIQDIEISADGIRTAAGVGVGSTLAEVEAAYGKEYKVMGKMYRYYEDEEKYMYFFFLNDVVKYYGYAIEVR